MRVQVPRLAMPVAASEGCGGLCFFSERMANPMDANPDNEPEEIIGQVHAILWKTVLVILVGIILILIGLIYGAGQEL